MILSEALDIEIRDIFYGLKSKKGDFHGDTVFLTRTELIKLVDFIIEDVMTRDEYEKFKVWLNTFGV